jgi:hypothetical protein
VKLYKKYYLVIVSWLRIFPRLFWEIIQFFINIPLYLYKFFLGLRLFSESYDGILDGLETQKKFGEHLKNSKNIDVKSYTSLIRQLVNETNRLKDIQERMFTGLFGILIAVLALFISVLALLIRK